jgi:hypothetical protein
MSLRILDEMEQGSDEWHDARRGIVTASMVGQLITVGPPAAISVACPTCNARPANPCVSAARKEPTPIKSIHEARTAHAASRPPVYEVASNDTSRGLTAQLVAERITDFTEPTWMNADMLRGVEDEPRAVEVYSEHFAPVTTTGFMVEDKWGFQIGYSPDGLVGDDGLIEVKSRRQKKHLTTILSDRVPAENMAQLQCGLLVSGRAWIDYVSYCGGMPLWRKRIEPDERWFAAIVSAVAQFETSAADMVAAYNNATTGLPATERVTDLGLVF